MVFKIIGSLRNIRSGNFSPHGQHRVNLKNLRQGHAFRSGDVWLTRSRRYGDLKHALVPAQSIAEGGRLAVPLRPEEWLADRQARLDMRLRELGRAARAGTIPGGFTDHVFAACAILGYRFAPRIRDLPSKRLYAFNPS
ncbi:TPA: transposase, partial [Klebsiella pneumoniae]|nr:transposase [Klebsiella pneumoniae]